MEAWSRLMENELKYDKYDKYDMNPSAAHSKDMENLSTTMKNNHDSFPLWKNLTNFLNTHLVAH
jgi:hypothetical protein